MELNAQSAIEGIIGVVLTYVGYRGKKMDEKIQSLEDQSRTQEGRLVKAETEVVALNEKQDDLKEDIKTMSFDVKEILRHLRDSK